MLCTTNYDTVIDYLATRTSSTVAPGDYGAVVGEQLVFNTGDDRQCHTVTIVNDNICEKHFLSDLAYVSGQQVITLDPAQARVVIVVDGDDCGECIHLSIYTQNTDMMITCSNYHYFLHTFIVFLKPFIFQLFLQSL